MLLNNYIYFILFYLLMTTRSKKLLDFILVGNNLYSVVEDDNEIPLLKNNLYYFFDKINSYKNEKVDVRLYYESLCPDCIDFDKNQFSPVVQKLSQYLNVQTYPYGNAQTIEKNGKIIFKCQHGPHECYGNKLHACAIDHIKNITEAVIFNSCMMEFPRNGSDDEACDRCAASMSLDSNPIKKCAKTIRGTQLLKYYGEESKKANFQYVPYILVNGKEKDGEDFMKDICVEFTSPPPPPCVKYLTN